MELSFSKEPKITTTEPKQKQHIQQKQEQHNKHKNNYVQWYYPPPHT